LPLFTFTSERERRTAVDGAQPRQVDYVRYDMRRARLTLRCARPCHGGAAQMVIVTRAVCYDVMLRY